jgi:hypothetical protein
VHAIHNSSKTRLTFLAILSPADAEGPFLVDCYEDEPWRSLRAPFTYDRLGSTKRRRAARRKS